MFLLIDKNKPTMQAWVWNRRDGSFVRPLPPTTPRGWHLANGLYRYQLLTLMTELEPFETVVLRNIPQCLCYVDHDERPEHGVLETTYTFEILALPRRNPHPRKIEHVS